MKPQIDVVIAGAGPVGCSAALQMARRGMRVLLAEAQPQACTRFAGEWLHPVGVQALKAAFGDDVTRTFSGFSGYGFCVHAPGEDSIVLPYDSGQTALSFKHHELVESARQQAAVHPGVTYAPGMRLACDDGRLTVAGNRLNPKLVVGADGKNSRLRQALATARRPLRPAQTLGAMAGLELCGVDLPIEGFGHVFLGGPGPMLLYRIGVDRIRISIDVPAAHAHLKRDLNALYEWVAPMLPPEVAAGLKRELGRQKIDWAGVGFRPRLAYGCGHIRLVGDAVGFLHPLTASGITLGLLDAAAVGSDFETYAQTRTDASYVPELLSNALYRVFSQPSRSALALRRAVFRRWRQDNRAKALTMNLLGCSVTDPTAFAGIFTRIGLDAFLRHALTNRQLWREFLPWAEWPLAGLVPKPLRVPVRRHATAASPVFAGFKRSSDTLAPAATLAPKGMSMTSYDQDWNFCLNALDAVSRTFSQPIGMLNDDLRKAVTCGYLLCRVADTIEDHPEMAPGVREHLYSQFLHVLDEQLDARSFALAFPKDPADDPEVVLARNLHRVWRIFDTLPLSMQATCRRWISEMTRGMMLYSARRPVHPDGIVTLLTPGDLERYCYFVAGTVGHMLTDLFCEKLEGDLLPNEERRLRELAEAFGMGLQLVNIVKDVGEDRERGVSFVPKTLCDAQDLDVADLTDPTRRVQAHAAVRPLIERAQGFLDQALDYALTIPADAKDIRLFCLLPLWMAVLTLQEVRDNDDLFDPKVGVKISRAQVGTAIAECMTLASDNAALRSAYARLRQPTHRMPAMAVGAMA